MMQWRAWCLIIFMSDSFSFRVCFRVLIYSTQTWLFKFRQSLFHSCSRSVIYDCSLVTLSLVVLLTYGLVRGPISNLQVACVSCGVQPCCSLLTLSHTDAFVPFEVDRCASSGDLSWLQQCWHELKGNLMIVGLSVQTINFFFDHVYSTSCLYLV